MVATYKIYNFLIIRDIIWNIKLKFFNTRNLNIITSHNWHFFVKPLKKSYFNSASNIEGLIISFDFFI